MNTSRAKLVEQDGYAPSPPHCACGVLLLAPRLQTGALGETRTPDSGLADRRVALTPRTHGKLGPCRTWAAGWLHRDPIGRSGLQSRIENRRFLKENGRPDGSRTRIPRLERPGS